MGNAFLAVINGRACGHYSSPPVAIQRADRGLGKLLARTWGVSAGFDATCCHRVASRQIAQNPRDDWGPQLLIGDVDLGSGILNFRTGQCFFDSVPNFFASHPGYSRISYNLFCFEHASRVLYALSQFIVRELIGFRGNDYLWFPMMLEPLVKLQIQFCGFVTRIYDMN